MTAATESIQRAHYARLEQLDRDVAAGKYGVSVAIGYADLAGREYERAMSEQVAKELAELRKVAK
jgi:hypothetical protein